MSHRPSVFPLYINVLSKQVILMCLLGGFYTDFNIMWDLVFSLQIHCLETKYIEVKRFVLHEMSLNSCSFQLVF